MGLIDEMDGANVSFDIRSPWVQIAVLLFGIIVAEGFVMAILHYPPTPSVIPTIVLDITLLGLLLVPFLFWVVFRPMNTIRSRLEDRNADLQILSNAIENMGHAFYLTDPNGEIRSVNPAFEAITGYSSTEAIGKTPRILKSGEMPAGYYDDLWSTLLNGDVWEETVINRRASGDLYHAHQTIAPVVDDTGEVEAYVAIQTDITDKVEQDRRLQTLIDNLPGMVYRCRNERGWPMEIVRGTTATLVGYSSEDLESGRVSWGDDVIHPDDRDTVWNTVQEHTAKDEPFELVYRVISDKGEIKWVWERGRVVRGVTGETGLVDGFVMDITRRKELEEDLQENITYLQVIDRVLRHNLNNDMNVIQGYAETIRDGDVDDPTRYATYIVEESQQLLETVDKERQITELLSEPQPLEPLDLGRLLEVTVTTIRDRYPTANVTVSAPESVEVMGTTRLGKAIEELTTNAIQYADTDTPTVDIVVEMLTDTVELQIFDNGPGIPEMEREVITGEADIEPLYHGSGLGLWMVNLIVRECDGRLGFEENEPKGSIVTISLQRPSSS